MGTEIERKFLVRNDDWRKAANEGRSIRQGYLSSNAKATVRVRTWDDEKGAITLKGKSVGATRAEFEYQIPIDDARELLELSRPHTIEKRRHELEFGGLTWEIDVFEGRHEGLIIAEVELEHEEQAVDMPSWIGEEVTLDDRYFNASLSRSDGVPPREPQAS